MNIDINSIRQDAVQEYVQALRREFVDYVISESESTVRVDQFDILSRRESAVRHIVALQRHNNKPGPCL